MISLVGVRSPNINFHWWKHKVIGDEGPIAAKTYYRGLTLKNIHKSANE